MHFVKAMFSRRARTWAVSSCKPLVVITVLATLLGACSPSAPAKAPESAPSSGSVAGTKSDDATVGQPLPGEPLEMAVEGDDPTLGNPDAKVTVVAYVDFQCPFCARGHADLRRIAREYGPERLRIVVKHRPLDFHPDSIPAAIAAQAVLRGAGDEAFFDYADTLMNHQRELSGSNLAEWAEDAGLSRSHFDELVGDRMTVEMVAFDATLGARRGVNGTPSFFVNGKPVQGYLPYEDFKQLVDAEEAAVTELRTKGLSAENAYAERIHENLRQGLAERVLAEDPERYAVAIDDSPVQGPSDALVTLIAFSDIECPFCRRAHPTVKQLEKKYGGRLRVVFKHLPLHFHERALPAAHLTDAVDRKKGNAAFFRALDALFAADDLSDDTLVAVGVAEGLTESEARQAIELDEPNERVERDFTQAQKFLVRGTPHFFINGRRLSGAQPLSHFEAVIDAELENAEQRVAAGTSPAELYAELVSEGIIPQSPDEATKTRVDVELPSEGRPSKGAKNAPVTVHVFSDFQCPFCRRAEGVLEQIETEYPKQVRVVWHNLPLPFHDRARPAAVAALEAFRQKGDVGFWKMHRALFQLDDENEGAVQLGPNQDELVAHARAQGLDVAAFERALREDRHDAAIAADEDLAEQAGISGTPGFVINGYLVLGAQPFAEFERVIDRALEDAKK